MQTSLEQRTATPQHGVTRPAAAVLLLTVGVLVLVGNAVPLVGEALALALGLELLVLARMHRAEGPLIAGGLLTGVGAAILLAAGPLVGFEAHVVGGVFVLAAGVGFGLVAALAALWLRQGYHWAWITALGAGFLATGLLAGPDVLATWLSWAGPVVLLAAGAALAVGWWHRSKT